MCSLKLLTCSEKFGTEKSTSSGTIPLINRTNNRYKNFNEHFGQGIYKPANDPHTGYWCIKSTSSLKHFYFKNTFSFE